MGVNASLHCPRRPARRAPTLLALGLALWVSGSLAHGQSGRRGSFRVLASAADADGNGALSAEEWTAFAARFPEGEAFGAHLLAYPVHAALARGDRKVDRAALEQAFARADRNGDGRLGESESGLGDAGGRRAAQPAAVAFAAADADGNRTVTADEWSAFAGGLPRTALAPSDVAPWTAKAAGYPSAEASGFTISNWILTLQSDLDADRNGELAPADLERAFAAADTNGDGVVDADDRQQAARPRRNAGTATGEIADRCLIPWQRNLDDALALARATGKPILICANDDGEAASEQLANRKYRDPGFARLVEGFVPLIVTARRRVAFDRDDRGRRLEDPRFGTVLNGEQLSLEPIVYERYFRGRRVAPRHVGVTADGEILFDVFLSNHLGEIDEALREHGVAGALPAVDGSDLDALLASPDAAVRRIVEQRFVDGDAAERERLASACYGDQTVVHPELLHLALRDPEDRVRAAAARAAAGHVDRVPFELWAPLVREAELSGSEAASALQRAFATWAERAAAADDAADESVAARTRRAKASWAHQYAVALDGLARDATLVDPAAAKQRAEARPQPPISAEEIPGLERTLNELDRQSPSLPGVARAKARALLRYAQIQRAEGSDPTFLLQDALRAAQKASELDPDDRVAQAVAGVAHYLLGDAQNAWPMLLAAARDLSWSRGGEAIEEAWVLGILLRDRAFAIVTAMNDGGIDGVDPLHLADGRALFALLARGPRLTAADVQNWSRAAQAVGAQGTALAAARIGAARFVSDPSMHQRLRSELLAAYGAHGLERAYRDVASGADGLWFAGYALMEAADRHLRQHLPAVVATATRPAAAEAAAQRAVDRFERAMALAEDYAEATAPFVALSHLLAARAAAARADWGAATAALAKAGNLAVDGAAVRDFDGTSLADAAAALIARAPREGGVRARMQQAVAGWSGDR